MIEKEEIREAIRVAYGKDKPLGSDNDYRGLQLDIDEETGKMLDVNTLKRFFDHWGKEKRGEQQYRFNRSTENIIALYLGYNDWDDMQENFGSKKSYIQPECIFRRGDKVIVSYLPNRKITVECLGNERFRILSVEGGGKLEVGDEFSTFSFRKDSLLVVSNVKRGNTVLGSYTSSGVIVEVKFIRKKNQWE